MARKDHSIKKKQGILLACMFWCNAEGGRLVDGAMADILKKFAPTSATTVKRIWAEYRQGVLLGNHEPNLTNKRIGRCGRKSMLTPELRLAYRDVGQEYANKWMRLSSVLVVKELAARGHQVSRQTVLNHFRILKARKVTLRLKPLLTQHHKQERMRWIINKRDAQHGLNQPVHYWKEGFDTVHVDESWFW
jgi:hypothetical protein